MLGFAETQLCFSTEWLYTQNARRDLCSFKCWVQILRMTGADSCTSDFAKGNKSLSFHLLVLGEWLMKADEDASTSGGWFQEEQGRYYSSPSLVINQSLVFKTMRLLFSLGDWLLNIITTNTRFLWTNAKTTPFITVTVSEVGIRSNRHLNLHAEDPGFETPSLQVAAWSIDSCPPKTSWNRLYKERQTKPYTCLRVMVQVTESTSTRWCFGSSKSLQEVRSCCFTLRDRGVDQIRDQIDLDLVKS